MLIIPNNTQHARYIKYLETTPKNDRVTVTIEADGLANYYFDEDCIPHSRSLTNRISITRTLLPSTIEYGEGPDNVNLERILQEQKATDQVQV